MKLFLKRPDSAGLSGSRAAGTGACGLSGCVRAGGAAAPAGGCADDAHRRLCADGNDASLTREALRLYHLLAILTGALLLHPGNRQACASGRRVAEKRKSRPDTVMTAGIFRSGAECYKSNRFGRERPAMRKTMNIWVLIAMSACVLVAFFWYSGTLSQIHRRAQ